MSRAASVLPIACAAAAAALLPAWGSASIAVGDTASVARQVHQGQGRAALAPTMAVERRPQRSSDRPPSFISPRDPIFRADILSARRLRTVAGAGPIWFIADTAGQRIELVMAHSASGFKASDIADGRVVHVSVGSRGKNRSVFVSGVLLDGVRKVAIDTKTSTVPLTVEGNFYSHRFAAGRSGLPRTLHFNDSTGARHKVAIRLPLG